MKDGQADDAQDDRGDRREDRAADGDVGKHHAGPSAGALRLRLDQALACRPLAGTADAAGAGRR